MAMNAFTALSEMYKQYAQVGGVAQPNATTMQQMQNLLSNWSDMLYNILQAYWQPGRAYQLGQTAKTPSLPANTIAICTKAGTTGAAEPTWPLLVGDTCNDGSVTWKLITETPQTLPADGGTANYATNAGDASKFGGQIPAYYAAAETLLQYAKTLSPVFTGTPKAPNPAANADSEQIATTAWVRDTIASLGGGRIIAGNYAQNGYVKWDTGLILQWGLYQGTPYNDNRFLSLPIAMKNGNYAAIATANTSDSPHIINSAYISHKTSKTLRIITGWNGEHAESYLCGFIVVGF